jgi:hypothetical protein
LRFKKNTPNIEELKLYESVLHEGLVEEDQPQIRGYGQAPRFYRDSPNRGPNSNKGPPSNRGPPNKGPNRGPDKNSPPSVKEEPVYDRPSDDTENIGNKNPNGNNKPSGNRGQSNKNKPTNAPQGNGNSNIGSPTTEKVNKNDKSSTPKPVIHNGVPIFQVVAVTPESE